MTPRPSADVLDEIRDILLRIERLLIREPDNATVQVVSLPPPTAPLVPAYWPVRDPGMPDPPLPPVRPQTTTVDPAPRTWMHGGWIHATGFSMVGP